MSFCNAVSSSPHLDHLSRLRLNHSRSVLETPVRVFPSTSLLPRGAKLPNRPSVATRESRCAVGWFCACPGNLILHHSFPNLGVMHFSLVRRKVELPACFGINSPIIELGTQENPMLISYFSLIEQLKFGSASRDVGRTLALWFRWPCR